MDTLNTLNKLSSNLDTIKKMDRIETGTGFTDIRPIGLIRTALFELMKKCECNETLSMIFLALSTLMLVQLEKLINGLSTQECYALLEKHGINKSDIRKYLNILHNVNIITLKNDFIELNVNGIQNNKEIK